MMYQVDMIATATEVDRPWLLPSEMCWLAGIGDGTRPSDKKMLNTLGDRGHIPYVKSGPGRTQARLYSCTSSAMLRTFVELLESGRTYVYAEPVALEVAQMLRDAVDQVPHVHDLEHAVEPWRIAYGGRTDAGRPGFVQRFKGEVPSFGAAYDIGVFHAGEIVWRVLESYWEYWAKDLEKRSVITLPSPRAVGLDGYPEGGE